MTKHNFAIRIKITFLIENFASIRKEERFLCKCAESSFRWHFQHIRMKIHAKQLLQILQYPNTAVGCMFSINMMNGRQMYEKQDIRFSLKEQKEFGIIH